MFGEMDGCTFIDSSQSAGRARDSQKSITPTVLPGCHLWAYELERPLIGHDLMALQGIPAKVMRGVGGYSEQQLADLAGNAFASTCSMAVVA